MSTKNVTLKEKVNGVLGDTLFPATTTPNVYDSAKSQALSQTLVNTPNYEALGFAKFSTATAYTTGDKVYKDNGLYRFIADKTAGEWDVAKVEPWSVEQEIGEVDDAIRSLIPAQASVDNKLADKAYVNDKVSTDTATFRGTFNLVTDLELTTEATQGQIATALGTAISGEDKNDYAFVQIPTSDATPTEIARIDRYKYTGLQWAFEYSLNNSGFTAEQWAAINSGITSGLVEKLTALPTNASLQEALNSKANAEDVEEFKQDVEATYAHKDGYYGQMGVGVADNLAGRGTVPAEYTSRTSGGDQDLGTGNAQIHKIHGKSIVWNQLFNGVVSSAIGLTITIADGIINIDGTTTSTWTGIIFGMNPGTKEGHKYLIKPVKIGGSTTGNPRFYNGYNYSQAAKLDNPNIFEPTGGYGLGLGMGVGNGDVFDNLKIRLQIYDLTLIFGAGNEPSTVEAFFALYPEDDYDYSAPVIKNNSSSGIKTVGFNLFNPATGKVVLPSPTSGNTTSGIGCVQISGTYTSITDADGNEITPSAGGFFNVNKATELTVVGGNATDTCIHYTWSGYRNGEYEPYEEHTLYFNGENGSLATVTGKLNGEGESVTIFPEGMKSAGTAHDEFGGYSNGYLTKGTREIGRYVITGNENWQQWSENAYYYVVLTSAQGVANSNTINCKADKIEGTGANYLYNGVVSTGVAVSGAYIYISASDYANRANLVGMEIIYVLATPLEYTLDEPIPANYYVNDFGTEERLPADTASVVAAPILYDVQYAMNAVDTLRRLPVNYINTSSMENFTTELASKLGTFFNATITVTPTYDSEHEEYDYSITIVANE